MALLEPSVEQGVHLPHSTIPLHPPSLWELHSISLRGSAKNYLRIGRSALPVAFSKSQHPAGALQSLSPREEIWGCHRSRLSPLAVPGFTGVEESVISSRLLSSIPSQEPRQKFPALAGNGGEKNRDLQRHCPTAIKMTCIWKPLPAQGRK